MRIPIPVLGLALLGGAALLLRARRHDVKTFVADQWLERPVSDKRYAELADELEVAGERLRVRMARVKNREGARTQLRHIVGIERWGQRRLRTFLGEEFVRDEHHPYKPGESLGFDDLVDEFSRTRQETVDLARTLSQAPPEPARRVEHNGIGPLTARGWLRYLQTHAEFEGRRAR